MQDFSKIGLKTIKNNMHKFLKYCEKERVKPYYKNYNKFLDENNLRGKAQTIFKKDIKYTELRNELIEENNYDLPATRYNQCNKQKTIDTLIAAREKFGDDFGVIQFRKFTKGTDRASTYLVKKYFGTFNKAKQEVLGLTTKKRHFTVEDCKLAYFEVSDLNNFTAVTGAEYDKLRDKNMPAAQTITNKIGLVKLRRLYQGLEYEEKETGISEFCELCRFTYDCEYNYNLKECPHYES